MAYTWPPYTYKKPTDSPIYDYSQGMLNTPDTAVPLNFPLDDDQSKYDFSNITGQTAMLPDNMLQTMTDAYSGGNQGIASQNIVPENMRQYLAGTDWRSQMQPASAFGTTGVAPMTDRIMDPDLMEQAQYRSMLEREPVNVPGINFKDAPVSFFNRQNNPTKGWYDRNIAYRALNKGTPEATAKWLANYNAQPGQVWDEGDAIQDRKGFQFPSFLGAGLGAIRDKLKRSPDKQAAYEAIMGSMDPETNLGMYKGQEYGLEKSPSGLKVYSEVNPFGSNLDSMFGSQSLEEQDAKRLQWAMDRVAKGKKISQQLQNVLINRGMYQPPGGDKAPIGPAITGGATQPGGGRDWTPGSRTYGTKAAAERTWDRPGAKGSPGYSWATGGRVGYKTGGRVGILAAF